MVYFDNDFAGRKAAETLKIILLEYEVKNYPPPKGKDYNDYLVMKRVSELKKNQGRSVDEIFGGFQSRS